MTDIDRTGWICGECGSAKIVRESIQPSLGDPRHPLGLCGECNKSTALPDPKVDPKAYREAVNRLAQRPPKQRLTPLVRPEEWKDTLTGQGKRGKRVGPKHQGEALPPDLWAGELPVYMNPGKGK